MASIFDLDEFKELEQPFRERQRRYRENWDAYKARRPGRGLPKFNTPMGGMIGARIENAIQPLFTPFGRAVRIDVALIPGGWRLKNPELHDAQAALFQASKWATAGDLFVKYGVAMGEAGIRIVDDRVKKNVYMMPVRPDTYIIKRASMYDTTPALALFVYSLDNETELAEVLEPTRVRTFINGQLTGVAGRPAQYPNKLGFVPMTVAMHDDGEGRGEPTFDDAMAALAQVNQQASYMAGIIKRHAEPQWAAFGAEPGDLEKSGDTVWFFPEGSDIKAVLAAVDFNGLLEFIREIKADMKESLPELAFHKLVGVERVAAATIELQMAEPVFKIRLLRKAYDEALAAAMRMAGVAAREMGLTDIAVLADEPGPELDADRPVITIDALTRLQIAAAEQSVQMNQISFQQQQAMMNMARGEEGA